MRSWSRHENNGYDLYLQGHLDEASRELAIACKKAQSMALGPACEAQSLMDLAEVRRAMNATPEAMQLYEQAAKLFQKADEAKRPSVWRFEAARALASVAELQFKDGKNSEALEGYKAALQLLPENAGAFEHLASGVKHSILKSYGELLTAVGQKGQAASVKEQTDELSKQTNTAEVSLSAKSFGSPLKDLISRSAVAWEKKEPELSKSIIIQAAKYADGLKENDPELLTNLQVLADSCKTQGDLPHAEKFYRMWLAVQEKKAGVSKEDLLRTMSMIGEISLELGKYPQSAEIWTRVIEMRKNDPPQERAKSAYAQEHLATALNLQRRLKEAIPLYEEALAFREKEKSDDSTQLEVDLLCLGDCYLYSGDIDKAEGLYNRLLSLRDKKYGSKDQRLADPLDRLSIVNTRRHNYTEARSAMEKACSLATPSLRSNDPLLADWQLKLAMAYTREGNQEKAQPLYENVIKIVSPPAPAPPFWLMRRLNNAVKVLNKANETDLARRIEALRRGGQMAPDNREG